LTATQTRHTVDLSCNLNAAQQIEDLLAWGFASAIAVVLLASTLVLLGIYNRFAGLDRLWG
jgi:ABC-type spermidine/putrescine transport system permease subunit I